MAYEELKIKSEAERCLLCHEAGCSRHCNRNIAIADKIRSIRFENMAAVAGSMEQLGACITCDAPCMTACARGKIDRPVDIPMLMRNVMARKQTRSGEAGQAKSGIDLSVTFCGITCENPFFLSSSVVGSNYEMVAKAFEMGWAGVAFKTIGLFVPQEVSPRFAALDQEEKTFIGFKNIEQISDHTLAENLQFLKKLKKDYPSKILIASIMGRNEAEWEELAKLVENAGADIIECNFSCPHMSGEGLGSDVGTHPELVARYTAAVKKATRLPVLAKMTPNITNMELPAIAAVEAGADGIAAINTIKSVMNVDLYSFSSAPDVSGNSSIGGYSGKAVKPIALRFMQELKSNPRLCKVPLSGMGGIETWKDAAEFMALGCETVQITTAVMQYGYRIIDDLLTGMSEYMRQRGYSRVSELIGAANAHLLPTDQLDRETIEYPRFKRELCVSCARCYLSCFDGGHQAIVMDQEKKKPVLIASKCVGCQLCRLVCPVGAIEAGTRVYKKESE